MVFIFVFFFLIFEVIYLGFAVTIVVFGINEVKGEGTCYSFPFSERIKPGKILSL